MRGKNATERVPADADGIALAARILSEGGLVAVPTETVYGLAARADSADAVARIYAAKGRPSFNPLIVHVAGIDAAQRLATLDATALALAERYWPGPLTLVCPLRADARLAPAVSAGLPTVALRHPAHPAMAALLEAVEFPLAAPSANRSGYVSPTSADHVLATLDGRIDLVLDGGACVSGLESTIVAVRRDGRIETLRPGPIAIPGAEPAQAASGIEAPGQTLSHYAPGKPVRLDARARENDEYLIGFGDIVGDCSLSKSGDLAEAAARLYACLHRAAKAPQPRIAVAPVPDEGLGLAINDRLRRAATPA
ncbi:threonylcarbamoyl-AMP synthase [Erythrobacter sp. QSSC1-22B]|uniref:L-threonylcarbamoyladenylate synthase n=1 Tax=Erythrobacter sp. QSSC1-22B TaxID=1860125 RepID=UPI000806073D|nr:L-threonylcarbamoyladenylate synthase [Erythrobacter sp. QSSC1-22B]OBX19983.1 threonylcarbamoyl-AMP synthase [Erythrobacter sp. QSSC1-22B]